ncbi:MAG: hypothetical protein HFJ59_04195 [Clostridia bacterium]|nr:hypothetical protein [Clostridia bacterium]
MEDVFKIRYNDKLDKLEIAPKSKREKVIKFTTNHKLMTAVFTSFVIFSGINIYLICTFFKILGNV